MAVAAVAMSVNVIGGNDLVNRPRAALALIEPAICLVYLLYISSIAWIAFFYPVWATSYGDMTDSMYHVFVNK